MSSILILGAIVMLILGIVFGYIASGTWPKGASAAMAAAPKRKAAPKKAGMAKRKSAGGAGKKDDLKKISGVGPTIEKKLHKMGVTSYAQIAKWKKADIDKLIAGCKDRDDLERVRKKLLKDYNSRMNT